MYLSRVLLNPRTKAVRRDMSNAYDMHRTLHRVFADTSERFLWRLELSEKYPVLLLQSPEVPNWGLLSVDNYVMNVEPSLKLDFLTRLKPGQLLLFRLHANTTVTREGKRIGITDIAGQLEWLQQRSEKNGFEIVGAMVSQSQRERFKRSAQEDGSAMTIYLQTAKFDGHLRVRDALLLERAVAQGIGPAKSFGCGLLSVREV